MSLQLVMTTIYPGNEWVRAVALMPKSGTLKEGKKHALVGTFLWEIKKYQNSLDLH